MIKRVALCAGLLKNPCFMQEIWKSGKAGKQMLCRIYMAAYISLHYTYIIKQEGNQQS